MTTATKELKPKILGSMDPIRRGPFDTEECAAADQGMLAALEGAKPYPGKEEPTMHTLDAIRSRTGLRTWERS